MENPNPILRYLSDAHQQQTPVMSNSSACVSRLFIISEEPLQLEADLTIGSGQIRTYAIQKLSDEQTYNPMYQVAPIHNGVAGPFSKLSESDLYYMFTGKPLTDEE